MAMTESSSDKKDRVLKHTWINRDGTVTDKLGPEVIALSVKVIGSGDELRCDLSDLVPEGDDLPPPSMLLCAAAFGVRTTVGNAVTAVKDGNDAKRFEVMRDRWEGITEGEWRSGSEGGPRLRYVVEAWTKVQAERQGKPCTEKQVAWIKAETIRRGTKAVLGESKIAAAYASIMTQKAIEEEKKALAAAAEADTDESFLVPDEDAA